jgi:hypothetical protein
LIIADAGLALAKLTPTAMIAAVTNKTAHGTLLFFGARLWG